MQDNADDSKAASRGDDPGRRLRMAVDTHV